MAYQRITPKARNGTSGVATEIDLDDTTNNMIWLAPPDRVAAITVSVHKKNDYEGDIEYAIEATCSMPSTIGDDGTGGYWDPLYSTQASYTDEQTFMLTNCVTGIRVRCIEGEINVAFVG